MTSQDGFKWLIRGDSFVGGLTHDLIGAHDYREPQVFKAIRHFSNKEKLFVDIGAHVGGFAIRMASEFKSVHAFEPNPHNHGGLLANIDLNGIKNVIAHKVALGNYMGATEINHIGASSYTGQVYDFISPNSKYRTFPNIPVVPLDAYKITEPIAVIKIDTEGNEEEILDGAKTTIALHQPIIILETHERTPKNEPFVRGQKLRLEKFFSLIDYKIIVLFRASNNDEHWLALPNNQFQHGTDFN